MISKKEKMQGYTPRPPFPCVYTFVPLKTRAIDVSKKVEKVGCFH
jgi:hypothetical protein